MREYDKMIQGSLYNTQDPELVALRAKAQKLCHKYNSIPDDKMKRKTATLDKLFGDSKACKIQAPFSCDYGYNIKLGHNFFANYGCVIIDFNKVTIGDDVMFGPGVHIYTATHPLDNEMRSKGFEMSLPVTIGNQVWIGGHATICPGVTIGDNTVISEGSVVTHSIPANAVALGNPCEVVRIIK